MLASDSSSRNPQWVACSVRFRAPQPVTGLPVGADPLVQAGAAEFLAHATGQLVAAAGQPAYGQSRLRRGQLLIVRLGDNAVADQRGLFAWIWSYRTRPGWDVAYSIQRRRRFLDRARVGVQTPPAEDHVPEAPDVPQSHLVRRLAAVIDFSFVHGIVRRHHSHTGKPSVDPVVHFKLWLLGYLFNITSERRLCEEASRNVAWRWFLGYELDEPIPDHSVLSKAHRRFGVAVYEQFFRRIVRLCEARGPVRGDVLFVDATLTKANASSQSMRLQALMERRLPQPDRFLAELWAGNEEEDEPAPRSRDPRGRRPNPDRKPRNRIQS